MGWLFLGMPWSKHTCTQCGTVLAGTLLRLLLVSVSTGFLGYALFGAIKSNVSLLLLPPALVLTLVILFLDLPMQIRKVGDDDSTNI
jgi:hypothetical protein